jgi:hypothetical protein
MRRYERLLISSTSAGVVEFRVFVLLRLAALSVYDKSGETRRFLEQAINYSRMVGRRRYEAVLGTALRIASSASDANFVAQIQAELTRVTTNPNST